MTVSVISKLRISLQNLADELSYRPLTSNKTREILRALLDIEDVTVEMLEELVKTGKSDELPSSWKSAFMRTTVLGFLNGGGEERSERSEKDFASLSSLFSPERRAMWTSRGYRSISDLKIQARAAGDISLFELGMLKHISTIPRGADTSEEELTQWMTLLHSIYETESETLFDEGKMIGSNQFRWCVSWSRSTDFPEFPLETPPERWISIGLLISPKFRENLEKLFSRLTTDRFFGKTEMIERTLFIIAKPAVSAPARLIEIWIVSQPDKFVPEMVRHQVGPQKWEWLLGKAGLFFGVGDVVIAPTKSAFERAQDAGFSREDWTYFLMTSYDELNPISLRENDFIENHSERVSETKVSEWNDFIDWAPFLRAVLDSESAPKPPRKTAAITDTLEIEVRVSQVTSSAFYRWIDSLSSRFAPSAISYSESNVYSYSRVPMELWPDQPPPMSTSAQTGKPIRAPLRVIDFVKGEEKGFRKFQFKSSLYFQKDESAWGMRMSVSSERNLGKSVLDENKLRAVNLAQPSSIRQRKRWSVRDGPVIVDASIVSEGLATDAPPTYEIELEIDSSTHFDALKQSTGRLLFALTRTPVPFSFRRRNEVIDEVHRLVVDQQGRTSFRFPSSSPGLRKLGTGILPELRNLNRKDLTRDGLGGRSGISYAVAAKADGETALLLIHERVGIWMITVRESECRCLIREDELRKNLAEWRELSGAILIGEWIPDENVVGIGSITEKTHFAVFDLLTGPSLINSELNNYIERIETASEIGRRVEQIFPESFRCLVKPVGLIGMDARPENVAEALRIASGGGIGETDEDRNFAEGRILESQLGFRTDGFVFTPIETLQNPWAGSRIPRLTERQLSRFPDVCKFKPFGSLTIDFRVVLVGSFSQENLPEYELHTGAGGGKEKVFSPGQELDFSTLIDWNAFLKFGGIRNGAVVEFAPVLGDNEEDSFSSSSQSWSEKFNGNYSKKSRREEQDFLLKLTPVRIRLDKLYPNSFETANSVWNDIHQFLEFETVAGSTNFELLNAFNNRVKRDVLERAVSVSATPPTVAVDVGSGYGGDLLKYVKLFQNGTLKAVLLVEPDPEHVAILQKRLRNLPDVNLQSRFFVLTAGGQDTQQIVEKASELIEFTGATRIIINSMLSLSFFWRSRSDLEQFAQTLVQLDQLTSTPTLFSFYTVHGPDVENLFAANGSEIRLGPVHIVRNQGNEIFINIENTIVENQTEYLVNLDDLREWISFEPDAIRHPDTRKEFLSDVEKQFVNLYVVGSGIVRSEAALVKNVKKSTVSDKVSKLGKGTSVQLGKGTSIQPATISLAAFKQEWMWTPEQRLQLLFKKFIRGKTTLVLRRTVDQIKYSDETALRYLNVDKVRSPALLAAYLHSRILDSGGAEKVWTVLDFDPEDGCGIIASWVAGIQNYVAFSKNEKLDLLMEHVSLGDSEHYRRSPDFIIPHRTDYTITILPLGSFSKGAWKTFLTWLPDPRTTFIITQTPHLLDSPRGLLFSGYLTLEIREKELQSDSLTPEKKGLHLIEWKLPFVAAESVALAASKSPSEFRIEGAKPRVIRRTGNKVQKLDLRK